MITRYSTVSDADANIRIRAIERTVITPDINGK